MTSRTPLPLLAGIAALVLFTPLTARAADPAFEVGTTMTSVSVGLGNNDETVVGMPSAGFGLLQPGVYASIYAGPFFAVEPQIGLVWATTNGHATHIVNFSGQIDYFFLGTSRGSPYVFGAAGVLDVSGSSTNPKSVGGGLGYRVPIGERLTFRVDGRYTHLTDGGGNSLAFALSIGGVLGQR